MNIGIVLRSYFPKINKVLIFDKHLGKICVSIINAKKDPCFTNGMIIGGYKITSSEKFNIIKDFEIIDYPTQWYLDISFLHHALELYQYCIPHNACSEELFELIYFLCSSFDQFKSISSKKIFLYKFFLILGSYPQDNDFYSHRLATYAIDNVVNMQIDLTSEKKICDWLSKCIKTYPVIGLLNAKNFLNELIYHENI